MHNKPKLILAQNDFVLTNVQCIDNAILSWQILKKWIAEKQKSGMAVQMEFQNLKEIWKENLILGLKLIF